MSEITNTESSPIAEVLFISRKQIEELKKNLPSNPTEEYGIIFIKTNRGFLSIPFEDVYLVREKEPKKFLNPTAIKGNYYSTPSFQSCPTKFFDKSLLPDIKLVQWNPNIKFAYLRLSAIDQLINSPDVVGVHFRFEPFIANWGVYSNLHAYRAMSEQNFDCTQAWQPGLPCPPEWRE